MTNDAPTSSGKFSPGWLLVGASVIYLILVWVGTHLPATSLSVSLPRNGHFDKLFHVGAYFGLAVLAASSVLCFFRPSPTMFLLLVLGLLALAMGDEVSQIPVPGRTGDLFDFLADVTGIVAGVAVVSVVSWVWRVADDQPQP